jgi:hypothetical protein
VPFLLLKAWKTGRGDVGVVGVEGVEGFGDLEAVGVGLGVVVGVKGFGGVKLMANADK